MVNEDVEKKIMPTPSHPNNPPPSPPHLGSKMVGPCNIQVLKVCQGTDHWKVVGWLVQGEEGGRLL